MRYRVELVPSAARAFRKLDHRTHLRVGRKIESLADNPRPPGVKLLSAEDRIYRLRAGDFRILYQVNDTVLTILVIAIGRRRLAVGSNAVGSIARVTQQIPAVHRKRTRGDGRARLSPR